MATLQNIRNRAGILIAVVIGLALVAFILSDFLNTGGSALRKVDLEVAEISGKSISYDELINKIEYLSEISKLYSGQSSIDDEGLQQIREQSWQQLIREYVLEEEYDKLGISVHPDEVFDMVQGKNIHPFVQNLFRDPNTGEINTANIIRFLKQINQDESSSQRAYWLFLEQEMITDRTFKKYTNLISKGLHVTNSYSEVQQKEEGKKISFDYVVKSVTSVADSLIEVSDADIKTYYKENKEDFKQEALRDVDYAIFNVVPSSDDDQLAGKYIDDIIEDFKNTENDKDFVNLNSDSPFQDKNLKDGELSNVINDFMFKAKIGDMFGPYFENNAYKIAKLSEINYLPDSVNARHILVQIEQNAGGDETAKALADSLQDVIKKGGNFAQLATQFSGDQGSAEKGGDLGWFKEGTMVKPFNDACFEGKVGDITVVKSQFGYHVIELLNKGRKVKKVKVAVIERNVEPSTATYQYYYQKASQFASKITSYESFQEELDKEKITKRVATDIKEFDKTIPGLESPREIIRWLYTADIHDVSPIFELNNSFVVAIAKNIQEEGYGDTEKEEIRSTIINNIKREKKAEKLVEEINAISFSSINELAAELNVDIKQANDVRFNSNYIPAAGNEPKVIATASVLDENVISSPIIGNNGVYVIMVSSVSDDSNINPQHKDNLTRRFQSRANYEAFETLKKLADIQDYRAKFF